MLFTTLDWLLSLPALPAQSTACGIEMRRGDRERLGLVSTVLFRKYLFWELINVYFLLINIYFKWNKINVIKIKNNTHFTDERAFWLSRGGGGVVTGMLAGINLSKPGMKLLNRGWIYQSRKKHNNHVTMSNNNMQTSEQHIQIFTITQINFVSISADRNNAWRVTVPLFKIHPVHSTFTKYAHCPCFVVPISTNRNDYTIGTHNLNAWLPRLFTQTGTISVD